MAHKTLISGTAYSVTGGRELIGGTGYGCKAGKALIGGTAFTVPFSKGIPLSTITPGAILYLNESGSPVPFYIAKHDYESGLNSAGRTLVVRKDCYDMRAFNTAAKNTYNGSALDTFLNGTYLQKLSTKLQEIIKTTKFYYTPGLLDSSIKTLERAVFQLSINELGKTADNASKEGTKLPIASMLQIAKRNGSAVAQWTRSPNTYPDRDWATYICYVGINGSGNSMGLYGTKFGSRPAFTLPATTAVIANADGTYTLAA